MHPGEDTSDDWRSRRLWSLWDMVANFSVAGMQGVLAEMAVLVRLANQNKEWAARIGEAEAAKDPKSAKALEQAVDSVSFILEAHDNLRKLIQSGHIDAAADRLRRWLERDQKSWADLFTRLAERLDHTGKRINWGRS